MGSIPTSVPKINGDSSVVAAHEAVNLGDRVRSPVSPQNSMVLVDQLVDPGIVIPVVAGSSPVKHPNICSCSTLVVHDLGMVENRVRFSVGAPDLPSKYYAVVHVFRTDEESVRA